MHSTLHLHTVHKYYSHSRDLKQLFLGLWGVGRVSNKTGRISLFIKSNQYHNLDTDLLVVDCRWEDVETAIYCDLCGLLYVALIIYWRLGLEHCQWRHIVNYLSRDCGATLCFKRCSFKKKLTKNTWQMTDYVSWQYPVLRLLMKLINFLGTSSPMSGGLNFTPSKNLPHSLY